MTISISVSDKDFGKGSDYFCNLTAKTPEEAPIPLEKMSEVLDQGARMYFTTFQTILAGRFATGNLSGTEFKELWAKSEQRIEKVLKFLTPETEEVTTS